MQCPVDGTTLAMADRQGIEVDYCPQCRGVWLDRGELDKLIAREPGSDPVRAPEARPRYDDDDDDYGHFGKKRKRKSFLSEMFEFGD